MKKKRLIREKIQKNFIVNNNKKKKNNNNNDNNRIILAWYLQEVPREHRYLPKTEIFPVKIIRN